MCYDFGLISGPLAAGAASSAASAASAAAASTAAATAAASTAAAGGIAAGGGIGAAAIGSSLGATGAITAAGELAAAGGTFLGMGATGWQLSTQLAGSLMSGVGSIAQGQQQKAAYEANAKMQRTQALDAQRRGSIAEGQYREQSKQFTGAQNAKQGGSGVIAGQDTGADILAESAEYGARDARTIKANAEREAWGFKASAGNDRYQGQMASEAGYYRGGSTFLSGVSNAFAPAPWWKKQWDSSRNG